MHDNFGIYTTYWTAGLTSIRMSCPGAARFCTSLRKKDNKIKFRMLVIVESFDGENEDKKMVIACCEVYLTLLLGNLEIGKEKWEMLIAKEQVKKLSRR